MSSTLTRREILWEARNGLFGAALGSLLARDEWLQPSALAAEPQGPLAAKQPHFAAKAKSCIFLFMVGGPSQVDLWDPKPELVKRDGQPSGHDPDPGAQVNKAGALMGSPFRFHRAGESGIEVSEVWPHLAKCIDDLAILRATHTNTAAHASALLQMSSGFIRQGFPTLGAWLSYGLGSANHDLPAFVVMHGGSEKFIRDAQWGSGFMSAAHQGTLLAAGREPIANLRPANGASALQQRQQLDLLNKLNDKHRDRVGPDRSDLAARIASYELAFRMQSQAPEVFDVSRETAETKRLYGLENADTKRFGGCCLLARRLVERGVRFVQLMHGDWDSHTKNNETQRKNCRSTDGPIAALLTDLKRRGLLDSTLVFWTGEMGRSPHGEGKDGGRDHHARAFTTWMAGGGIQGGQVIGATDELGYQGVQDRTHVHDLHATILHQMGLDHERLTYFHGGRDHRLTDVAGRVIQKLIA